MPNDYIRIERDGDTIEDTRDFQWNGGAVPSEPFEQRHANFFNPVISAHTGFASDGSYYQDGVKVAAGVNEDFGTAVHELDLHKWRESGAMTTQLLPNSVQTQADGTAQTWRMDGSNAYGKKWQFRGDFSFEVWISDISTIFAGVGEGAGQDNAVALEIDQTFGANTYTAKYFKTPTREGLAAEVTGVGTFIGEKLLNEVSVILRVYREGGLMVIEAEKSVDYLTGHGGTVVGLWNGAVAGIVNVALTARDTGGGTGWEADFARVTRRWGWTNYSSLASWYRETVEGILYEDFWGDELNQDVWTKTTAGTADMVPIPGLKDLPGEGLLATADNIGASTEIELATITGDFRLQFDTLSNRTKNHIQLPSTEDVVMRCTIRPVADQPRILGELIWRESGGTNFTSFRFSTKADDATPPVVLAFDDTLTINAIPTRIRWVFERRGSTLWMQATDIDSGRRLANVDWTSSVKTVPTVPLSIQLRTEAVSTFADLDCNITNLRLTSPHAFKAGYVTFPSRYYAAQAYAEPLEVTPVPGGVGRPVNASVGLVDITARQSFWHIVSSGTEVADTTGDQALPAGRVVGAWADFNEGSLWLPVHRDDSPTIRGFCRVDFALDEIVVHRATHLYIFSGNIQTRHLGLGDDGSVVTGTQYLDGNPLRVETVLADADDPLVEIQVWATDAGIKLLRFDSGALTAAQDAYDAGLDGFTTVVHQVSVTQPTSDDPPAMCVLVERRLDQCVAVYPDLVSTIAAAAEVVPGDQAQRRYTGLLKDVLNTDYEGDVLFFTAAVENVRGIHAIRTDEAEVMFAVTCPFGVTVLQHHATPGSEIVVHWDSTDPPPVGPPSPQAVADSLTSNPSAVWLTKQATLSADSGTGFLLVQQAATTSPLPEILFQYGAVEVIGLHNRKVRTTILSSDVGIGLAPGRRNGIGITAIEPPPGAVGGIRIIWGYGDLGTPGVMGFSYSPDRAIVEWDELVVSGGPWSGPHIGGTTLEIEGSGMDEVVAVVIGGVGCFRVGLDIERPGVVSPPLLAVNKALGFIENGTPIMADDLLEATQFWPKDIELRWADGLYLLLPGAFTYESRMCIEHTLKRLAMRLPENVCNGDPKRDALQRHILTAVAWEICQIVEEFHAPLSRATYRLTATGTDLDEWGAVYGVAKRPLAGMNDADFRVFIAAKAFGLRVTIEAIKDMLEPIFGYRPTITEGYRTFTVEYDPSLSPDPTTTPIDWWGDDASATPITQGYFSRDFWAGDELRVQAAREVLEVCRLAGIEPKVTTV